MEGGRTCTVRWMEVGRTGTAKNEDEWKKCSIDSYGLGIIWSSRFEVHSDQVVGLANKIEKPAQAV